MEYQKRFKKAFDKTIAPNHFQQGDLILRKIKATIKKVRKLDVAWEEPFRVVRCYHNGSYKLETVIGHEVPIQPSHLTSPIISLDNSFREIIRLDF
jgi:hypothetical protein